MTVMLRKTMIATSGRCGDILLMCVAVLLINASQGLANPLEGSGRVERVSGAGHSAIEIFTKAVGVDPAQVGPALQRGQSIWRGSGLAGEVFCEIHQIYETQKKGRFGRLYDPLVKPAVED